MAPADVSHAAEARTPVALKAVQAVRLWVEQLSRPVDQDLYAAVSTGWPSGRSTSLPASKRAPARTSATRWGALTARQRSWAASMSLNAIARPVAREPGPLVTLVRCRTVAKVDSIVIWSRSRAVLDVVDEHCRSLILPGGRGYLPSSSTRCPGRFDARSASGDARFAA